MRNQTKDIKKLPKWAQKLFKENENEKNLMLKELNSLKQAHSILFEHDKWFTISGPPENSVNAYGDYNLFFLSNVGAHPACSLGVGDVLLVGRKNKIDNPQ